MFERRVSGEISLCLALPQFSREAYALIDSNRAYLGQWLPWVAHTDSVEAVHGFFSERLLSFARGESLTCTVFYQGQMAGVIGYNEIKQENATGKIGYWLGEDFTSKGIMTLAVHELIQLGREYFQLQKVEIRCATGNHRSRGIPERLGFAHEGTLRRAEKVGEQWHDHEVYGLLL